LAPKLKLISTIANSMFLPLKEPPNAGNPDHGRDESTANMKLADIYESIEELKYYREHF
jgi:oligoribonuclease (3'-5' exoribonuclease)